MAVKDEMLPVKLAFMLSVAEELEPFLAEFQTEKPMVPFLATALDGLLQSLLGRIMLKGKLDAAGTFSKLMKIDLENPNNIIGIAAFDLAAKSELRKITKPSYTVVVGTMAVTIKAYLEGGEIRRFVIENLRDFGTLHGRIQAAFPALAKNMQFTLSWKDADGDEIVMSSDAELAEALRHMKDGLLKINVAPTGQPKPSTVVHTGVLCDVCDQEIHGVRYKCLQCEDYDLCGPCHGRKVHEEHDMLKLVNPGIRPLWSFPGWKRLWRHCGYPHRRGQAQGSHRFAHRPDQKQHCQEVLRGIGDTVANLLEPLGITVDVLNDMASNTCSPEQPKKDSATEPMDMGNGEPSAAELRMPAQAAGTNSMVEAQDMMPKAPAAVVVKSLAVLPVSTLRCCTSRTGTGLVGLRPPLTSLFVRRSI
ncbi:hypothetical protein HPB50_015531 [Hyalomma asiaticum]|uniref:Uncharacterized protein n=1 Tax=Hyalomma asiaticum TaxID=266040 RepID=A0ACB7S3F7_HYAAI|nr:hypothetical protein HPB50_015531 [Hyalomma asiaticum]